MVIISKNIRVVKARSRHTIRSKLVYFFDIPPLSGFLREQAEKICQDLAILA